MQKSTQILKSDIITQEIDKLEEFLEVNFEKTIERQTLNFQMSIDSQKEIKINKQENSQEFNLELDLKFLISLTKKNHHLEIVFQPVVYNAILQFLDTTQTFVKICLIYNKLDYGSFSYDPISGLIQFRSNYLFCFLDSKILSNILIEIKDQFLEVLKHLNQDFELVPAMTVSINRQGEQKHQKFLERLRQNKETTQLIQQEQKSKNLQNIDFVIEKFDVVKAANYFDKGGSHEIYRLPYGKYPKNLAFKRGDEINISKLKHEMKILHSFSTCDYIIQAYRSKQFSETVLFMDYCQYKNLRNFLSLFENVLSLKTKLMILYQIGLGIQHLHNEGIQHFDIKPENILIDDNFTPKICDFGEAFIQKKGQPLMYTRTYSVPYQAPECLEQNYIPTFASDVFSFGVILFETIFCCLPFQFNKKEQYLRKFKTQTYEIEDYNHLISLGQRDILQNIMDFSIQCMLPVPKQRPALYQLCTDLRLLHDSII